MNTIPRSVALFLVSSAAPLLSLDPNTNIFDVNGFIRVRKTPGGCRGLKISNTGLLLLQLQLLLQQQQLQL